METKIQPLSRENLPSLEPQQTEHAPDSHVLLEYVGNRYPSIQQFLSSLITDTGHKGRRLTDETQLLYIKYREINNILEYTSP